MAGLIPELCRYMCSSIAPSTRRTYNVAWSSYSNFICRHAMVPFPLQQLVLLFYVTSLGSRVSYKTIKVYLAGIAYFSKVSGYLVDWTTIASTLLFDEGYSSCSGLSISPGLVDQPFHHNICRKSLVSFIDHINSPHMIN